MPQRFKIDFNDKKLKSSIMPNLKVLNQLKSPGKTIVRSIFWNEKKGCHDKAESRCHGPTYYS